MVSLFGRLQTQDACSYRLQQLLSFHGYEKSKLQINPLGPGTLPILFSNQVLLGQSKCSCKYFVEVSTEKLGWGE